MNIGPLDKLKSLISTTTKKAPLQSLATPASSSSLMSSVPQSSSVPRSLLAPPVSAPPPMPTSTPKTITPGQRINTSLQQAIASGQKPTPSPIVNQITTGFQNAAKAPVVAAVQKPQIQQTPAVASSSIKQPLPAPTINPVRQNVSSTIPPQNQSDASNITLPSTNIQNDSISSSSVVTSPLTSTANIPAPTVDPNIAIRDALRQQLASIANPTAEETALIGQIDAKNAEAQQLALSTRLGVSGLEGQGRGIPLALIRGQQAKLQEQGALQGEGLQLEGQTLAQKLARMQAARSLQGQSLQEQLGYVTNDIAAKREAELAATKPFNIGSGESIARFNPATGKYEFASAPQSSKPIEINGQLVQQQPDGTYKAVFGDATQKNQYAPGSIGEYQFYAQQEQAAGRTPVSFNEYQTQDANRKAKAAAITAGGLNSAQQTAAFKLADDYEKASGDISKVISNYNKVVSASTDPTAAGDLSLIFAYMKMLDPGSVVREGEFATAQNASGVPSRIANIWNKALSGERLNDAQRKDFVNQSKKLYDSASSQQKVIDKSFTERSNKFGVPPDLVIRSQGSYLENQQNQASGDALDAALGFSNALSTAQKGSIETVTIGSKPVRVSSAIKTPLAMADADFFAATGKHLQINEAERSIARQAQLYEAYKKGIGGRAAPPGQSFHETGKAVDVGNWKEAEPFLRKYGFKNNLADDKNHFSIGEFA